MTGHFPYPRPYHKGHSREQDEKLAGELFYGTTIRDKKTGRDCHRYPSENSPYERQGVEALCRLLLCSCQDLDPEILAGLLCSLDLGGSFGRRLVFKPRKRKRPADSPTDLQIALYVGALVRIGEKKPINQAMVKFGVSRETVFRAKKRIKRESPWLNSIVSLNRL
jgi:hypothetical protein